jgi:hypothetical protein
MELTMNLARRYIKNVGIGLDQLLNAAVLLGDPRETISSRADKAMREGKRWGCILCRFLSKIQKQHCQQSLEPDAGQNAIIPD